MGGKRKAGSASNSDLNSVGEESTPTCDDANFEAHVNGDDARRLAGEIGSEFRSEIKKAVQEQTLVFREAVQGQL